MGHSHEAKKKKNCCLSTQIYATTSICYMSTELKKKEKTMKKKTERNHLINLCNNFFPPHLLAPNSFQQFYVIVGSSNIRKMWNWTIYWFMCTFWYLWVSRCSCPRWHGWRPLLNVLRVHSGCSSANSQ